MNRLLLLTALLVALATSGFSQAAKNESSSCSSFPCIVASVSLTNQSTPAREVVIYTPPTSGLFRVAYYEVVAPGTGSGWMFTWQWTDDFQEETFGPFQLDPGYYFNAGIQGMRVSGGHPITYTVTPVIGTKGLEVYNFFATVEQLQ
jgi:hypothetical protein